MNRCVVCGCTDRQACVVGGLPCHWALELDEGLVCSACEFAPLAFHAPDPDERLPLSPPLLLA
ncbi:MAG: hypothetical protein ABI640_13130 [Gammaproteobacteria bacterium]